MPKAAPDSRNLLALTPRRLAEWEPGEAGRVVVLVPKFRRGPIARWLMRHLRRPYIHVKLDELGSFVWQRCDGKTSIEAIAQAMHGELGVELSSLYQRIGTFLSQLERGDLIAIDDGAKPGAESRGPSPSATPGPEQGAQ